MALSGWDLTKRIAAIIPAADSTLSNFPFTFNICSSGGTSGYDGTAMFDDLGSSSLKIAVEDVSTGNQLPCEIEFWDATSERAQITCKIPTVSSTDVTVVVLYFDSTQPDNTTYVGVTGSAIAQSVWDSNYKSVLHLVQDPSAGNFLDSTSNANDGTPVGSMTAANSVDGEIGKAISMSEIQAISLGSLDVVSGATATYTLEIHLKKTANKVTDEIFCKYDSSSYLGFRSWHTTTDFFHFWQDSSDVGYELPVLGEEFGEDIGNWQSITITRDASTFNPSTSYTHDAHSFLGRWKGGTASTVATSVLSHFGIGARLNSSGAYVQDGFEGIVEEVRVSDIVRIPAWRDFSHLSFTDTLAEQVDIGVSIGSSFVLSSSISGEEIKGLANINALFSISGEIYSSVSGEATLTNTIVLSSGITTQNESKSSVGVGFVLSSSSLMNSLEFSIGQTFVIGSTLSVISSENASLDVGFILSSDISAASDGSCSVNADFILGNSMILLSDNTCESISFDSTRWS